MGLDLSQLGCRNGDNGLCRFRNGNIEVKDRSPFQGGSKDDARSFFYESAAFGYSVSDTRTNPQTQHCGVFDRGTTNRDILLKHGLVKPGSVENSCCRRQIERQEGLEFD